MAGSRAIRAGLGQTAAAAAMGGGVVVVVVVEAWNSKRPRTLARGRSSKPRPRPRLRCPRRRRRTIQPGTELVRPARPRL
jgi:hypothetical protein